MPARGALVIAILLVGVGLRLHALGQSGRFHPDEALFSTFARSAALNGQWLFPGPLDKPPLALYASALAMALLVDSEKPVGLPDLSPHMGEFAARLPGTLAGILLLPLAYSLARALYPRQYGMALLTLALAACSPYMMAFAATAFTDALMLPLVVLALAAAAHLRWTLAGVALGLAFLAKQQALLALPLVIGLGWAMERRVLYPRLPRLLIPIVAAVLLLLVWDGARGQSPGVWTLAAANNDPWRLLRPAEVWPRLAAWARHGAWLLGPPLVTVALLGVALAAFAERARHHSRARLIDTVLLAYAAGYLLLHWLVAFNTYDRYLLLVFPPLALLAARGGDRVLRGLGRTPRLVALALLAIGLGSGGLAAATQQAPLSSAVQRQTGIDAAAAFLADRAPGAILYDHWLGWELDYYLGQWSDKRRVYYPSPAALAADALRQPDPAPRYFIAPAWQPHTRWLAALHNAGFSITVVYDDLRFIVYELLPPA